VKRFFSKPIVLLILFSFLISVASAQTPSAQTPRSFVDKAAEKQRIEERENAKRWRQCKTLRKQEKVAVRDRSKFMKECMAR
jgi:hypothetical protein